MQWYLVHVYVCTGIIMGSNNVKKMASWQDMTIFIVFLESIEVKFKFECKSAIISNHQNIWDQWFILVVKLEPALVLTIL